MKGDACLRGFASGAQARTAVSLPLFQDAGGLNGVVETGWAAFLGMPGGGPSAAYFQMELAQTQEPFCLLILEWQIGDMLVLQGRLEQ